MKHAIIAIIIALSLLPGVYASDLSSKIMPLTLDDCVQRVLENNLELAAARHHRESKRNRQMDVNRLPNPELEFELENFGRTGVLQDVEMGEHTIFISQPVPLGGKRRLAREAAAVDLELADLKLLQQKGDLVRQTRNRFAEALLARELMRLAEHDLALATDMRDMINRLFTEGAVSASDLRKARLFAFDMERKVKEAETAYRQTVIQLVALWGGQDADQVQLADEHKPADPSLTDTPSEHDLSGTVHQLICASEQRAMETASRLAGKLRVPDVAIRGGYRTFHDTDEHAFIAGISLQLPVFNSGKWKAGAARAEALQRTASARSTLTRMQARLAETRLQLTACRETGRILETEMLPIAQTELESSRNAYREGLFNYLQVLESVRAWTDLRKEIARTRARADQLQGEIEYLTLRP